MIGRIAQLVERLLHTQKVTGSSPVASTRLFPDLCLLSAIHRQEDKDNGKDNQSRRNGSNAE